MYVYTFMKLQCLWTQTIKLSRLFSFFFRIEHNYGKLAPFNVIKMSVFLSDQEAPFTLFPAETCFSIQKLHTKTRYKLHQNKMKMLEKKMKPEELVEDTT